MTNIMNVGVYQITCISDGKRYIGSSTRLNKRFIQHKSNLRYQRHENEHMQRAWNKYGEKAFTFEKIMVCDKESIRFWEKKFINGLNPEFNCAGTDPELGLCSQSEESRKKISIANKGRIFSEESRKHMSLARLGNKNRLGIKHSEESKKKMSDSRIGHKYALGYKHTEETKEKMSISHMGNKSNTGRKLSEEHKKNISLGGLGRKDSDEVKKKRGDSVRRAYQLKKELLSGTNS